MKKEMKTPKEINVLPPAIFNLLAAGEVVENPASIVKEAVENSLDAGVKNISINIIGGGIDEICVIDDGIGIAASQISKVFLPHATSKISAAKDLESIGTLGFRGEALSSIASVSRVELVSKTRDEKLGSKVQNDGKIQPISANQGTRLTVKNLFYNTPARKKFLLNTRAEQNNVTGLVQKMMLSNPDVCFKYIIDSDIYYDYRGGGLGHAVELIYGKDIVKNLIKVNAKQNDLKLEGYISVPNFTKKNRTWQTVIVNGRAVEGETVSRGSNDAYNNYLTVGAFPFFVLSLSVDGTTVDVNVHPRKAQVKFSNETQIFEFVRNSVMDTIDAYFYNSADNKIENVVAKPGLVAEKQTVMSNSDKQILDNIKFLSSSKGASVQSAPRVLNLLEKAHEQRVIKAQTGLGNAKKAIQGEMAGVTGLGLDAKWIGNLFDTYILLSSDDCFYIVDQHAAQERLLYDELMKQIDSGTVATQLLVEPSMIYLTPAEMNQMEAVAPYLIELGIECENFGGNCFRITAVPVAISERGVDTVIGNVLREVKGIPPTKLSTLVREKVIKECCKASIKAGQSLTNSQTAYFLSQFKKNNMTPLCPHGRPIIISFTKAQIEKMFFRKA